MGHSSPQSRKTIGVDQLHQLLSVGCCKDCNETLKCRIEVLVSSGIFEGVLIPNNESDGQLGVHSAEGSPDVRTPERAYHVPGNGYSSNSSGYDSVVKRGQGPRYAAPKNRSLKESAEGAESEVSLAASVIEDDDLLETGNANDVSALLREQRELIRLSQVGRKKDFMLIERVHGKNINVLEGLELHTGVFSAREQKRIVDCVYDLQKLGRQGYLQGRTYSEPRKWMRGKGRVTMQFGCCYNYALDKNGNPPGIIQNEEVDVMPTIFKSMIKRMVRWRVLPPSCAPNSCIVNIYDEGDCIPPHIDHHDFVRPFSTVSFLSECNILFGSNLKIVDAGKFSGPAAIPLPVGSVLILNGNGADVAKHCVPSVPSKRISITFRRMDDSKIPYNFTQDSDLQDIQLLSSSAQQIQGSNSSSQPTLSAERTPVSVERTPVSGQQTPGLQYQKNRISESKMEEVGVFHLEDEFPPLSLSSSAKRPTSKLNRTLRQ